MAQTHTNIEGLQQLVKNMNTIKDKALLKATRAGINAGMTPLVQAIRRTVTAQPWPQAEKKTVRQNVSRIKHDVKKTVGKKLRLYKGEYTAKVGFGVGKKRMSKEQGLMNREQRKSAGKMGVGISAQDIHWFVLGTQTMAPRLMNVIPDAVNSCQKDVYAIASKKIAEVLEREANKLPK